MSRYSHSLFLLLLVIISSCLLLLTTTTVFIQPTHAFIPSYYVTKTTTDGQLVQVNLLEEEIERFFKKLGTFPGVEFDEILSEYFPSPQYITPDNSTSDSKILVNNIHVTLPLIEKHSGPEILSKFRELQQIVFVGNVHDLGKWFNVAMKKDYETLHVEFNKDDIIYSIDQTEMPNRLNANSGQKRSTIFDTLNLEPGVERFHVAFRRKFQYIHKNHLRLQADGFTLMLWERSSDPNKRPFILRMWQEVYDRSHFVYQNFGERLVTPYEHEQETNSRFFHMLNRMYSLHENERGNPNFGITEDMNIGYTPKRVLEKMFPLTEDDNKKIRTDMLKIMQDKLEFAFPVSTQPVFGFASAKTMYSALMSSSNLERAFLFPMSPVFSYNNDHAVIQVSYLIYPKKKQDDSRGDPVSCPAIIHMSLNHIDKFTKLHFYFDLNSCINKLFTGNAKSNWVTIDM
ncbi:predicted protein [Naegleria gruberi]|uniref:Predicted protein n=1 Tax=Naegleria gruberi TaxID=5762 RepID=D2VA90_NAEGR|nr:uncharacterized protein NAEGRDRAFT_65776 [Naegleria gruberi]EFC46266.1 predicted protein [Naegleria gruberi]|eukprot:XP_002679010.1 predicted protein [Naegleria gruberi strain NEG-M]